MHPRREDKVIELGKGKRFKKDMDRYQSADEVEKRHLEAFGQPLGQLYHALENDVIWVHAKWLEYRKLYGKSEERLDLLNETAGFFFGVVQRVLWDDVLVHIARLTDPPKQGRFENLTLLRLTDAFKDTEIGVEVQKLVGLTQSRAEFARAWRNRRIAHSDLQLALNLTVEPLPGISRQNVGNALASIRDVMNLLHRHYLGGTVGFEYFIAKDDADTLVYYLSRAAWAEKQERERFRRGEWRLEDSEPPPEI